MAQDYPVFQPVSGEVLAGSQANKISADIGIVLCGEGYKEDEVKVKDLIEQLEGLDGEAMVIISQDGEGNSYSPLADISTGNYCANTSWSGELRPRELTDELIADGYSEKDIVDGESCIVLWPTN